MRQWGLLKTLAALALLGSGGPARPQSPHQVLLVVNAANPDALAIANHYQELRRIPASQVVYLNLSSNVAWKAGLLQFREQVLAPVNAWRKEHWSSPQPPALVLSPGFPTVIFPGNGLGVSSSALLQSNGWFPPKQLIEQGAYLSPWFAGPFPGAPARMAPSVSLPFGSSTNAVAPCMMLGVLGPMSRGQILEQLDRSARADGSRPGGPILFATKTNVRSVCRADQIPVIRPRLEALGVPVVVQRSSLPPPEAVAGLMTGLDSVPEKLGRGVQPGIYADHLTSFAAAFQFAEQTKLTFWLERGAAASAGTVYEPYALWTKFPHARVFEHLVAGCTMLEAITLSLASPMQTLAVGDPLCKPWGAPLRVSLEAGNGKLEFDAEGQRLEFALYQDGVFLTSRAPPWYIPSSPRDARVESQFEVYVVSRQQAVARYGYASLRVPLAAKHPMQVEGPIEGTDPALADSAELVLNVSSTRALTALSAFKGRHRLVELSPESPSQTFVIRLKRSQLGEGPSSIRLVGRDIEGQEIEGPLVRVALGATSPDPASKSPRGSPEPVPTGPPNP